MIKPWPKVLSLRVAIVEGPWEWYAKFDHYGQRLWRRRSDRNRPTTRTLSTDMVKSSDIVLILVSGIEKI